MDLHIEEELAVAQRVGALHDLRNLRAPHVELRVHVIDPDGKREGRVLVEVFAEGIDVRSERVGFPPNLLAVRRLARRQHLPRRRAQLLDIFPCVRGLLELLQRLITNGNAVPLEDVGGAAQRAEELVDVGVGLGNGQDVGHQPGEGVGVQALGIGRGVEALLHIGDERLEDVEAFSHVGVQVLSVGEHPLGHPSREGLLGRLGVKLEPPARRRHRHRCHLVRLGLLLCDRRLEDGKIGVRPEAHHHLRRGARRRRAVARHDPRRNLGRRGHPIAWSGRRKGSGLHGPMPRVVLQELGQLGMDVGLPKPLVLHKRSEELLGDGEGLAHVALRLVHPVTNLLALANLVDEVAVGAVEALDELAHVEKVGEPRVHHRRNRLWRRPRLRLGRVEYGVGREARREDDLWRHQLDLHFEHRRHLILRDVLAIDLLSQEPERPADEIGEPRDNDLVDILHVGLPRRRPLGHLQLSIRCEEEPVDGLAAVDHLLAARREVRLVLLEEVGGRVRGVGFAAHQRRRHPLLNHVVDLAEVVLEHLQLRVRGRHLVERLLHEVAHFVRLPSQMGEALPRVTKGGMVSGANGKCVEGRRRRSASSPR